MIRILLIIALLTTLPACEVYSYRHGDYSVTVVRNAVDVQAASVNLKLADGSVLAVVSPASKPDANVVTAFTSIFQSIVGLGAVFLKVFGL